MQSIVKQFLSYRYHHPRRLFSTNVVTGHPRRLFSTNVVMGSSTSDNYNRLIYNLQKHVKISNYKKITYLQTQIPMIQCNLYSTKKTIGKKKKKKKKRLNTKGKNNKFLQDNEDNVKKIVVKKKEEDEKKIGKFQQLKNLFNEYGWVFMTYWTGVWASNGILCYIIIEASGLDGIGLLKSLGSDNVYDIGDWDPRFLNAFIAIEINELLELIRFPIILATTPKVAKWWRSRGK